MVSKKRIVASEAKEHTRRDAKAPKAMVRNLPI